MSDRPKDYVNLSELAINVAQAWKNNHSDYLVKFTNFTELAAESLAFRQKAELNATYDIVKKKNTEDLRVVNKEINAALGFLRKYLRAEYPEQKDMGSFYSQYGLERGLKGIYDLPSDNDRRRQRISILIAKLGESDNPFTNKQFGLAYWQGLKNRHSIAWEESRVMKANKSILSREVSFYKISINEKLKKLYAQIKIDFPKADTPKVLREFGFLGEIYK